MAAVLGTRISRGETFIEFPFEHGRVQHEYDLATQDAILSMLSNALDRCCFEQSSAVPHGWSPSETKRLRRRSGFSTMQSLGQYSVDVWSGFENNRSSCPTIPS